MGERIVLMGMGGALTHAAFWALYEQQHQIVAVIKPFPQKGSVKGRFQARLLRKKWFPQKPKQPLWLNEQTMPTVIPSLGFDLMETTQINHPDILKWLRRLRPDLICVATYPQLLKAPLLALPSLGAINMHPSLLPMYRGPNPLFWMFKEGATAAGISIHFLDEGIDSGDLLYQKKMAIQEGMRGHDLHQQLALLGGPLLLQAVQDIFAGTASRLPQNLALGSYHSRPTPTDLRLDPQQTVAALYHFVRGVAGWMPLSYQCDEVICDVRDAIEYHKNQFIPGDFLIKEDHLLLNVADGWLKLKVFRHSN